MRGYAASGLATVRVAAQLPMVGFGNGLTLLSKEEGTILIADSIAGVVWRVNVHTGKYYIAIDHPALKPIPTAHPAFGVNGLKVVGSDLFFSSTNQGLFGKFPISLTDATPRGPPTVISNMTAAADDFDIGPDGSA